MQLINTIFILSMFALCVDGKHMMQATEPHVDVVAKYADVPSTRIASVLTGEDFTVKRVSDRSILPPDNRRSTKYFMKNVWKYMGADK